MNLVYITGTIATVISFLISFSLIDQILLIRKEKKSSNISAGMFFLVTLSYFLWFLHGISIGNWFMIISQGLGAIMAGLVLLFIKRYR